MFGWASIAVLLLVGWSQAQPPGPRLDIHVVELKEGGLRVEGVRKSGLGEQMKLAAGDIIQKMDGKEVRKAADLLRYIQSNSDNIRLEIQRKGEKPFEIKGKIVSVANKNGKDEAMYVFVAGKK
jgi:S1-C subfamily serine protease